MFGEKDGWERVNFFYPGQPARRAGADQCSWGWGRPPYFEQVGVEHQAVRERVGLLDMTSFGKIDVTGPGALELMQRLTDNNIDVPVGRVTYTQFLNARGGIESDVTVTRWGEDRFRVTSGTASVANDLGWIRLNMPTDGAVKVVDATEDWTCLALWGSHARDLLQTVTEDDVSNDSFPYMTAKIIRILGVEVWAQRLSYAGELGWELYLHPDDSLEVWETLLKMGKDFDIQPVGYKALDSLRLEKGYRMWGADITPDENPYEAAMGFCVRLKSGGNFIGRDTLVNTSKLGIQHRLCTIVLSDDSMFIFGGEAVYAGGRLAGRVRSGGYGYTVGKNIALSYLPLELTTEGTPVEVEVFGELIHAQVTADVLYDPEGKRLRL